MPNRPNHHGSTPRFPLLLIFTALLALSLACSLPFMGGPAPTSVPTTPLSTPTTRPTPTPQPLPPALVESDPPPGAEIPLKGFVKLYFNQPMERSSVESALESQPGWKGKFTWANNSTLSIQPAQPLQPESKVSLSLGQGVRSSSGLSLSQPVSLTFQTAGYLHLTQSLPEPGAKEIDPTSAVVAAFNRPVVPLGADPDSQPTGFTIQPAAAGRGEWLNTSTYIFYPQPSLEGGKAYTVQLNPDLHSAEGSPLDMPTQSWSFTTALPRLVSSQPAAGAAAIRLDQEIILTFNQPMDISSVEGAFHLLDSSSSPVPGKFSWNEANTEVTFTPLTLLARSTLYSLNLDGQAKARGGTPLGAAARFNFQTVPNLSVTGSDPAQGGQKSQYSGVSVHFSSPIQTNDILPYVTITPTVTNQNVWVDESQFVLNVYGDFDPAASYTLTLSANLPDPWGGTLGQPYTLNFTTATLPPQLVVTTGSDTLFLTPQDASLTVQAINLSQVPITLGSVKLKDFMAMMGPGGYDLRKSYRAADEHSWVQSVEVQPNRSQQVSFFVSPDHQPLKPGIYYLKFNLPAEGNTTDLPYLLVVSSVQLTFKISATDTLVWALDLRSSQPLQNAPLAVYNESGDQLAAGQSDDQGIFQANISPRQDPYSISYAVLGQPGQDNFALGESNWSQGFYASDFGITNDYRPPRQEAYLYTDRPIYRPGQKVYFRAVARQAYNGRYSLLDTSSLQLKLYDPLGAELQTFDLSLSAFGTAHGEFDLSPDLQPGYYRLAAAGNNADSSLSFQVADYRKPEINLQVSLPSDQVSAGQDLAAAVNARYFFDAPAGNVPVKWALYSAPSQFDLPGYQVGVLDTSWLGFQRMPLFPGDLGIQVASGEATTDAQGLLKLNLPTVFSQETQTKTGQRQRLTLEVTLQDESGLPVSARAQAEVNPAEFYIGVRPDAWIGQAGQQSGFEVLAVDWKGNPAGIHNLRAEFNKVIWVQQESSEPAAGITYTPQYTLIGSTDFSTNDQGQARLAFTPTGPGTYQLNIAGEDARTESLLWVGGPGQAVWPNLPNQRLRLTADRQDYQPGDTAQVFIPNPFGASVPALITLERSVILSHQVVNLEPGGSVISLSLTGEDAPNGYVSVTLLGKNGQGRPDFRQGYLDLPVKPIEQTLNVTLTSQPQRVGPGGQVTFEVLVTDSAGKPVKGEFSLAVVDLAALVLADPNAPDILPTFYGEQPLGVQTGLALAVYAQRAAQLPAGVGGGGGAEVPPVVRENFPDTAYWNAEVITGENGKAQVSVTLPDSLTTWQVDLRGLTADTRVGQAQSQVVTSKDLLVRPVVPRFFVVNDHVQLAAIVQNNTTSPLQAQVSLQADGFSVDDTASAEQSVNVPAGGRTRVEWWGSAQDVESVDLIFSASSGELQDAARPALGKLPVLHYSAPQTFASSGVIDQEQQLLELVSLPRSFDPSGGSLQVDLAPSLAASMLNSLEALEHFPYECTEQTVSRFLPNLETYRILQQFGIQSSDLKDRLDRTLNDGLQRLLSRQNQDGGWGWWKGEASDPFISAYVLIGLGRARQAGSSVNPDSIQRGVDFLRSSLPAPAMLKETWQLDRLAFEEYALAQAGASPSDQSGAEALYQVRDQLNPWAQALLALTLDPNSDPARTLVSDLEATAVRSATGVHWEEKNPDWQNMSGTLSTSAIVLYALAQRDPGSTLLSDAVRYLMAHRTAGNIWDSTYSTAWTLMAMAETMRGTGELGGSFSFSAGLNGVPLASGQAAQTDTGVTPPVSAAVPLSSLYPDLPNALTIQRSAGPGRLYYSAGLTVSQPVESVAPLDRGISVSRSYTLEGEACGQDGCTPIQSANNGDKVEVRLTLTLPHDAYYLMVEDYIPAGAEILNTTLKTSQQGAEAPQEQPTPLFDPRRPFESGWGWWYFDIPQIYDNHIAWTASYLPAGTYQLTYTLVIAQPGQYRILPARAWQFYFPEVQGNSSGALFEIKP